MEPWCNDGRGGANLLKPGKVSSGLGPIQAEAVRAFQGCLALPAHHFAVYGA